MKQSTWPRLLAVVVALAITLGSSPVSWSATTLPSVLEGTVFDADGITPRSGIIVTLAEGPDGPTWESTPTGPDGAFRVDEAPEGQYTLLLRDGDAVYLGAQQVPLRAGQSQEVHVAVRPNLAPAATSDREIPRWGEWLIFGSVAVVGAFLVSEIFTTQDSEDSASPFKKP